MLGLPLDEAVERLRAMGIEPRLQITRAPRRPEGTGALRVIRVREEGRELTVAAFMAPPREEAE